MSVATKGISDQTQQEEDVSLFGDIFGEAAPKEGKPCHCDTPGCFDQIPEHLVQYDIFLTNSLASELGEQVFLHWLKARLNGDDPEVVPVPALPAACETNPDIFFPDEPYDRADEYPLGVSDPQFVRDAHDAYVDTLTARSMCFGCPLQKECFSAAVIRDERYGVWGGYGVHTRDKASNYFHRMRRDYNAGRMPQLVREDYERRALAS